MVKEGKWFYTGHVMPDSGMPRTIYVEGDKNIKDCIDKGLKSTEKQEDKQDEG